LPERRRCFSCCVKYFVFYDKPLIKFERLLETYVAFSPKGIKSFLAAMPVWMKEKLLLKNEIQNTLVSLDGVNKSGLPPILFGEHHEFQPPRLSTPRRLNPPRFCA
jgi:carbamoyltransferase